MENNTYDFTIDLSDDLDNSNALQSLYSEEQTIQKLRTIGTPKKQIQEFNHTVNLNISTSTYDINDINDINYINYINYIIYHNNQISLQLLNRIEESSNLTQNEKAKVTVSLLSIILKKDINFVAHNFIYIYKKVQDYINLIDKKEFLEIFKYNLESRNKFATENFIKNTLLRTKLIEAINDLNEQELLKIANDTYSLLGQGVLFNQLFYTHNHAEKTPNPITPRNNTSQVNQSIKLYRNNLLTSLYNSSEKAVELGFESDTGAIIQNLKRHTEDFFNCNGNSTKLNSLPGIIDSLEQFSEEEKYKTILFIFKRTSTTRNNSLIRNFITSNIDILNKSLEFFRDNDDIILDLLENSLMGGDKCSGSDILILNFIANEQKRRMEENLNYLKIEESTYKINGVAKYKVSNEKMEIIDAINNIDTNKQNSIDEIHKQITLLRHEITKIFVDIYNLRSLNFKLEGLDLNFIDPKENAKGGLNGILGKMTKLEKNKLIIELNALPRTIDQSNEISDKDKAKIILCIYKEIDALRKKDLTKHFIEVNKDLINKSLQYLKDDERILLNILSKNIKCGQCPESFNIILKFIIEKQKANLNKPERKDSIFFAEGIEYQLTNNRGRKAKIHNEKYEEIVNTIISTKTTESSVEEQINKLNNCIQTLEENNEINSQDLRPLDILANATTEMLNNISKTRTRTSSEQKNNNYPEEEKLPDTRHQNQGFKLFSEIHPEKFMKDRTRISSQQAGICGQGEALPTTRERASSAALPQNNSQPAQKRVPIIIV